MSPNIPPVFEALPAEVLGNILRQVASPEDLYSTIRASPSAFGSFRCFREAILIEVLQAHLPAEIFAEYLGLLHIPKYEDFNHVPNRSEFEYYLEDVSGRTGSRICIWERCRHAAWGTVLCGFFATHFENVNAAKSCKGQIYGALKPTEKHQINYVMSIYGMLKRFIRDYQSFVRSILTGSPPPLSDLEPSFRRHEVGLPQSWPSLCENESIRLQRGFLRYEICSRSNAIPKWTSHIFRQDRFALIGVDEFKNSISRYIPCWEEEEIRCVWAYTLRQYQVLVREVVAEFRCDVRRLSRKTRHAPDNKILIAPRLSDEVNYRLFEEWAFNMSSTGLPMLQQLLRSGFDDQRRFLKNTTFALQPILEAPLFMNDSSSLRAFSRHQESYENPLTTSSASPLYTSVIWDLARWPEDSDQDIYILDTVETELKDVGWVFWEDRERLRFLQLPDPDTEAGDGVEGYLGDLGLRYRYSSRKFDIEKSYPEQSMYVTTEDYQGELSAKYAVGSPKAGGEHFFPGRLRNISDWPSKQASPAFQEICGGLPAS